MNLIDFHVTKIINEEYGKVYELYNGTRQEVDNEEDEFFRDFLLSDGVKQTYEYWDDGGIKIDSDIFRLGTQYYKGYIGHH